MTSPYRILVVEDDPDGQEVIARILRYHRIDNQMAMDAEQALALLHQMPFDAAILDLSLPGMDGWSLLAAIRADPALAGLRCIAVTGYHSPEMAVRAVEAGFAAYFPKPVEATSFVRELQHVLDGTLS